MRRYLLALAGLFACSGCQSFDPTDQKYQDLLAKQGMVISPYSPEHATRHGPGFAITITRDEARRLGAPDSEAFRETIKRYLADERSRGNDYCPLGHEVVKTIPSKHWYTEIWVDCKNKHKQSAKQSGTDHGSRPEVGAGDTAPQVQ